MTLTYPSHIRWFRKNSSDPLLYFTGKNGKKIKNSIDLIGEQKITYEIKPLEESFFKTFIPLYEKTISEKQNGVVHDVYLKTLGKDFIEFPYFSLSIYDDKTYIGGTIFSQRKDRIAYAYRAYKRDWENAQLKANPAILAEYFIAKFASDKNIEYISHGRDRNPYGINSAIGLATFKLSVGCSPILTEDYEINTLQTEDLEKDSLIFTLPESDTSIEKAYLVTSKENEDKYIQVSKYPELITVETIYRE